VLLIACATSVGQKFDTSYVQRIERDKTTKADVIQNIGKPYSVTTSSQGEMWLYRYAEGQDVVGSVLFAYGAKSAKQKMNMLMIQFEGNYVKDFTYTQQE